MKTWFIITFILAFGASVLTSPIAESHSKDHLLGSKECTWGPSHWCSNFENAKKCHATKHCIQTVWQHKTVPEDNDSVCQICLDMVKQARDQLESNETQDDIRAVFEGSCKLIYIKPVVQECIKLADNFIPELIEALASQMNPQVVCSVAGLCNNAKIDKLIEEYEQQKPVPVPEKSGLTCDKCDKIASAITTKFHGTSRDDVLENMLQICGQFSSFSDACSSILLTYFNEIYEHLENNLNADGLCHLSGVCASRYHQHPEIVEIRPMSDVGRVSINDDPDIPCELCEQLVQHLRDLLVANTTESEFKQVMDGLCKQTKGFKDECLALVDQYYAEIYEMITKSLSPSDACFYMGICKKGLGAIENPVIAPLVPINVDVPPYYNKKKLLGVGEPKLTHEEIQQAQLPIDRLMGAPNRIALVDGGSWCTMCEYALHFIQEELSNTINEEKIKNATMNVCKKMPNSVAAECRNFVELYADAIIALLIQEVDPSLVCPQMKLCPPSQDSEVFAPSQIDVQVHSEASNKASCPLCLLAVEQAQQVIQTNKTIDKIKETLEHLCSHLNNKLKLECNDFVETYSKELVEMLMKDFTPQEICVYLKLCTDKRPDLSNYNIHMVIKTDKGQELETNEIPDNTIDGIMISTNQQMEIQATPECMLCQEIIKQVEKRIPDKPTKAQIEKALEQACTKVPKKVRSKCENYVEVHGDKIADLILEEMAPKEVCRDIQLCFPMLDESEIDDLDIDDAIQVTVFASPNEAKNPQITGDKLPKGSETCVICEMIVARMEKDLSKQTTQEEVRHYLQKVCNLLPRSVRQQCDGFVNLYATLIIQIVEQVPPKKICEEIKACLNTKVKSQEEIVECAVCESVLDHLLKVENIQDADLDDTLEGSCQSVPARYNERCLKMLQIYGISMFEQVKAGESFNICSDIGMCYRRQSAGFVNMEDAQHMFEPPTVTKKPFLVGENECTWGPSHWCRDEETATKCGSLDYCQSKKIGKWSA